MKIKLIHKYIEVIRGFKKRGGYYVFLSSLVSKIIALFLSVFIVRLLPKKDYADYIYAFSIITTFSAFAGLGSMYGYLRYGAITKGFINKLNIRDYVLKYGSILTIVLIIIFIITSPVITTKLPQSQKYLIILCFWLLFRFWYDTFQSHIRVLKLNKLYAFSNNINSLILFVLALLLSFFFNAIGYVIAVALTPLLAVVTLLMIRRKYNSVGLKIKNNFNWSSYSFLKKEFWSYSFNISLGSTANQFFYTLDILFLAYFISNSAEIANYKVATIIPLNLLFFPSILFQTDFVYLAENHKNKNIIKKYYFDYLKLFVPLVLLIFLIFLFGGKYIIPFIFGVKYIDSVQYVNILLFGSIGLLLLRTPLGNILGALGYGKVISTLAILAILINVIINYFMIKAWGTLGIAISTAIIMWLPGFVALLLFIKHLKSIREL